MIIPSNVAKPAPDPQTIRVSLAQGGSPANVAFTSNSKAYVSFYNSKSILPVNFTTGGGSLGTGIAIAQYDGYGASATPDGTKFYAATSGFPSVVNTSNDSVSYLSQSSIGQTVIACNDYAYLSGGNIVRAYRVSDNGLSATINYDSGYNDIYSGGWRSTDGSKAYFVSHNGTYFRVSEFAGGQMTNQYLVSSTTVFTNVVATDSSNVYTLNSGLGIYKWQNGSNVSTTTTISASNTPSHKSFAISPSGNLLYIGCESSVLIVDTATMTVVKTLTGMSSTWGMAVSPDGSWVSFVDMSNNRIYGIGV